MALGHAVLAALLQGEASGYDLAKAFNASVANFWVATPQQFYRELDRLEAAGLIEGRVVEQQRRPNKRLFSLTPAGLEELAAFTAEPSRPTSIKDELLVKIQAVRRRGSEAITAALQDRLTQAQEKLAGYDRLRDALLAGRDEDDYLRDAARLDRT